MSAHTLTLELTSYEDRTATFEVGRGDGLTFDSSVRFPVTVRLSLRDWDDMGRPQQLAVTYTVEPVR